MRLKRILASIFVLLLVFLGSNKILDILQDKKMVENYGIAVAEKNKSQIVDHELLILLVGVDKNPDTEDTGDFTRTDTIMLCKVNTETGNIDILSIPRDSRIKVREEFTKANHAHAYGGIDLTLQSLRNFLGIDIDYYAEVNYDAVVSIVDALGGVDYNVPKGIHVVKGGDVDIRPGQNHLNGNDVLWYLRTRHIYENGDLGRVGTQQEFVKAMVDEIVKKSSKQNLTTFIESYIKYVKTNVPMSLILDILTNISSLSSDRVSTYIVPGVAEMIGDTSYYIPDYQKTWDIIDEVFSEYKLDYWKKSDSGYTEYTDFSYSGEESQIPNTSIDNYNDSNQTAPAQDYYYQDPNQTTTNYQDNTQDYYYEQSPAPSQESSPSPSNPQVEEEQGYEINRKELMEEAKEKVLNESPEYTYENYSYYEYVYPKEDN